MIKILNKPEFLKSNKLKNKQLTCIKTKLFHSKRDKKKTYKPRNR